MKEKTKPFPVRVPVLLVKAAKKSRLNISLIIREALELALGVSVCPTCGREIKK